MKLLHVALMLIATALYVGCAKSDKPAKPAATTTGSSVPATSPEHTHGTGPNGGVVFDFGGHHGEFTVDHGKKECAVVVLGDDEKTLTAIAATELILVTKETKTSDGTAVAPMTITLKPADAKDGKATKFVGTDPGLGNVADFAGTVSGEVDSKPAQGEFAE